MITGKKNIMPSRTAKIIVDILMLLFIVLSLVRWEGSPVFHIVVGSGCFLLFTIHVILNKKQLTALAKANKSGKLPSAAKLKYWINILLIVVWSVAIVSGFVAIGHYSGGIESLYATSRIHGISSRLGCLLILVHALQHHKQIISYFKRKATNGK